MHFEHMLDEYLQVGRMLTWNGWLWEVEFSSRENVALNAVQPYMTRMELRRAEELPEIDHFEGFHVAPGDMIVMHRTRLYDAYAELVGLEPVLLEVGKLYIISEIGYPLSLLSSWQEGRVFRFDGYDVQENGTPVVYGTWWDDPDFIWTSRLDIFYRQVENQFVNEYREVPALVAA